LILGTVSTGEEFLMDAPSLLCRDRWVGSILARLWRAVSARGV